MGIKLYLTALLVLVAVFPDTEPLFGFDTRLKSSVNKLPESFSEGLLANSLLSDTEHLFVNEIRGPESFASFGGKVYTSLGDGRIVQILADRLQTIAFLDPGKHGLKMCGKNWFAARNCGRPLGLKFDSKGTLYTIDPNNGIHSINVDTGETKLLMDINVVKLPNGNTTRFLDDLAFIEKENGHLVFYISLGSNRWFVEDSFFLVAEQETTGKLLSFDTEIGKLRVEVKDLSFPNGLEVTDNKKAILFCELNKRRILKYHIDGADKGKLEVVSENLPGEPDNIKRSADTERETYWIALFSGRNQQNPSFELDVMADKLLIVRRFFFRLLRLVGFTLETIGKQLENDYISQMGYEIKTAHVLYNSIQKYGMAVEIDSEGKIINSLHSPDGYTSGISEVFELDQTETERHFYIGSFQNPYIGRLSVKKSSLQQGLQLRARQQPKLQQPKYQQEQERQPEKQLPKQETPTTTPTPGTTKIVPNSSLDSNRHSAGSEPDNTHPHQEL